LLVKQGNSRDGTRAPPAELNKRAIFQPCGVRKYRCVFGGRKISLAGVGAAERKSSDWPCMVVTRDAQQIDHMCTQIAIV